MHRRKFLKKVTVTTTTAVALPAVFSSCGEARVEEIPVVTGEDGEGLDQRLVALFTEHLKLCNLQSGETLLFYYPTDYARKEYVGATLTAAAEIGAEAFALEGLPGVTDSEFLIEAFKAADIVYGRIPLYSDVHNIALAAGTRTVTLNVALETLERFFPDPAVIKRGYAGAEALTRAREMRVTDDHGSDFTLFKEGRKGSAMVGVSAEPGTWDQFPHGSVACAPLEGRGHGVYMINPGDTISRLGHHVRNPVRLTLENGRVTNIEGGEEADHIRGLIAAGEDYRDSQGRPTDPRGIGHAGWGIDHRADWDLAPQGRDSQMWYGSVMVSIGANFFDAPARYSGLGGQNFTPVHIDVCCRHKNVYLDGELVLNRDEQFLRSDLV